MFKEKWESKQVAISVISCIVVMLLVFSAFFSITVAWLTDSVESPSSGVTNLGEVKGGLATSQNVVEVTMPQAGGSLSLTAQSRITNESSLSVLVRVFYSFVIDDTTKQIATTNDFTSVEINSDFVASEENITNVYSGYYFYNKLLPAGGAVNFLNTVYPTSSIAGQKVKLHIYCEMVNYEGGPYKLNQELPWKNTPASWLLNYDNLTKSSDALLSPKLDIKFSEIKKIEITAKTNSSVANGIIGRFGGAYIGVNNSGWVFNGLNGASASIPASTFSNGAFNVVSFTWGSCTALTDDYLCLAWDSGLNKEISFKQIRIWNMSGELVYDLRPNVSVSNNVPTGDGKFVNRVDNSVMPMYTFSSGVATSSASVYEYIGKVLYYNGFDSAQDVNTIVATNGASKSFESTTKKNGTGSLKVTNAYDIEDVGSSPHSARVGLNSITLKAGYTYNVSMWVMTDAPEGTMSYSMTDGKLFASVPSLIASEASNLNKYGEWTLLSVEVEVDTDTAVYVVFTIPTGTAYTTYIDDLVVSIVE